MITVAMCCAWSAAEGVRTMATVIFFSPPVDTYTHWVYINNQGEAIKPNQKPRRNDMGYKDENGEIFGRVDDNGNVVVLYAEDGEPVRRIDANLYPVDSDLSTRYEHPEGIVLSREDAESLGIEIE